MQTPVLSGAGIEVIVRLLEVEDEKENRRKKL